MKSKWFPVALSGWLIVNAQTAGQGRLLSAVDLPAAVNDYRNALSGAFDREGHERRTLTGTISYQNGDSTNFSFQRELDQHVRLDLGAAGNQRSLVVTGIPQLPVAIQNTADSNSELDHDVLETLASDTPEALLYLFGATSKAIPMGKHYQPPGTDAQYPGPFWDVVGAHENSPYQTGSPDRLKRYYFDNATRLLTAVRYVSAKGAVEVDYAGWTTNGNQSCPGTITRQEAGITLFTITISSCRASARANDNAFSFGR